MTVHRPDPETDPFRPPVIPTEVFCLHCQQEYESYLMEWRERMRDGKRHGFWCCPTPGCSGKGFGFDIFPIDPDYRDENGEPVGPVDEEEDAEDIDDDQWVAMDDDPPWGEPIDADALLEEDPGEDASDEPPSLGPPINLGDDNLHNDGTGPLGERPRWSDDEPPW